MFSLGIPTSYAAPPSGPVPSVFHQSPYIRIYSKAAKYYSTTEVPLAILKYISDNNGKRAYKFE